jgi:aspartate aminotransferase
VNKPSNSKPLSDRVQLIKPSPTLAVTAKAAELRAAGQDVIGLGAGEPDFDTPEHIRQAAIDAINAGFTRYTAVDGLPELKQAILDKFQRENQLEFSMDEILVSCGAKHSLYNLTQALLNPGNEVLIPAPYWVSYPDLVLLTGATPVILPTTINQAFKLSPQQLEEAITEQSRLLILNSPSNPTGAIYNANELKALASVLLRHPQIMIVCDDIYEHIRWNQQPFDNLLTICPELKDRTLIVNGVSKAYAMTGWRIGYTAGPPYLIKAMKKIQSQSTSNPTAIAQKAAQTALNSGTDCLKPMLSAFESRHRYVVDRINTIPGLRCIDAEGAFYCLVDATNAMKTLAFDDDVLFSAHLLEKTGVALVPGSAFGANNHLRLSFATSMNNLQDALNRIEEALTT